MYGGVACGCWTWLFLNTPHPYLVPILFSPVHPYIPFNFFKIFYVLVVCLLFWWPVTGHLIHEHLIPGIKFSIGVWPGNSVQGTIFPGELDPSLEICFYCSRTKFPTKFGSGTIIPGELGHLFLAFNPIPSLEICSTLLSTAVIKKI